MLTPSRPRNPCDGSLNAWRPSYCKHHSGAGKDRDKHYNRTVARSGSQDPLSPPYIYMYIYINININTNININIYIYKCICMVH